MMIDGIQYDVRREWRFAIRHPRVLVMVVLIASLLISIALVAGSDPAPWNFQGAAGGGRTPLHM